MRIAILGTRGIPNRYGGFEELAEKLALILGDLGHEVYVYCSSLHPFQGMEFNKAHLIRKKDPENFLGTFGQFIYDLNCILDSRKRNFDVILQLGYTSSSVWASLLPAKTRIFTNMDGLEWKRSKYSLPVKKFLKLAESWAVRKGGSLVSDSVAIQDYIRKEYQRESTFIPYGAEVFTEADEGIIRKKSLTPYEYYILVARFEPENNIEMIIKGHQASGSERPLVLIGSFQNSFGQQLIKKYNSPYTRFYGAEYEKRILNNLRYYSRAYFHGHSVGGTNPSLLEAMGCNSLIYAHDNEFNKSVLNENAYYFKDENQITSLINTDDLKSKSNFTIRNLDRLKNVYNWNAVAEAYLNLFTNEP